MNRNIIAKFLVGAMTFAAALPIWAETWTDPDTGYTWTYRINGDEAEIYNYYWSCAILPLPTGSVTIPSMIGDKPVTRIGDYAFCSCTNLTQLKMPDSIKSVGYCAFYDCREMASMMIPDGVTKIGGRAFEGCSGLLSISVGVNNPNYSSANGLLLTKDGETLIQGVNGDVVIPDCVKSIGAQAFACCYGLRSVTFGTGVTSIEGTAFYDCSALTRVVLPDSVTSISSIAFAKCSSLTSIYIPANMTNILWGSLAPITPDYNGLTNISVSVDNQKYKSVNGLLLTIDGTALLKGINGEVVIPDGVTSIEFGAFAGCGSLKSVRIPNGVVSISAQAFDTCISLTNIVIPASVTNIEQNVFAGCDRLLSIEVEDGNPSYQSVGGILLTKDGTRLVTVPGGMTSVSIPDGVESVGDYAFKDYGHLTSVTMPESVRSIGYCAFYGCNSLTNVTLPVGMMSIGDLAFEGCNYLLYDRTTIPGAKLIDGWAVGYVKGLRDLDLAGARGIGGRAFAGCNSLTNVTISSSVKHVGPSAFYGCDALINVVIEDGVESFGYCAFSECNALTSVELPASVTNIGSAAAFTRCGGMMSYEVADGNPSYKSVSGLLLTKDGKELICGINGDVIIPDGVTRIGSSAFEGCVGLTSVTIPDSVTGILQSTFVGCSGLQRATIPGGVILSFTFSNCNSLENVVFMGDAPLCLDGFRSVAAGCSAYVSPKSTGWGVEVGGVWNGLTLRYWSEVLTPVSSDAEVVGVLSVFVDGAIAEEVTTVAEYESFKEWIDEKNLYQPAVVASPHAAAAYLLGAERLFENEPTVVLEEMTLVERASGALAPTMAVSVVVKDGERVVAVDAEKVAAMFEATGDLGDWNGAARLTPTVTTSGTDSSGKMTFVVTPGDGTAGKAFLRIKR